MPLCVAVLIGRMTFYMPMSGINLVIAHHREVRRPNCPGRFIAASRASQLLSREFASLVSRPPCVSVLAVTDAQH
jgi:hypothetical protein